MMSTDLGVMLQAHLGSGYTIERELGGGMSRVFIAQDHRLGRRVAIKVLLPTLAASVSVDRFNREIMLVASLQHPNIVPVLTAGELDHLPYFVMPFITGDSLRVRMLRGPLSVRETVSVMKDVARALAYAHRLGIVHRDIKPDNVLLTSGTAMVTDFGVAKALSVSRERGQEPSSHTLTEIGVSIGTPAYMAPEQAAADPGVDHRADLYAFGVVAYEMLVGTPPFQGRTPQATLAAQISERPATLAARRYDVPAALAELVMQCLEKEPARRPTSAAEVVRRLEVPEIASGTFAVPDSGRRRRRRSRLLWGAAATVTTAVVVAASLALRTRMPRSSPASAAMVGATSAPLASPSSLGRSLAVLPLEAAGGGAREIGIAAGITSELTNAVSSVPGLRVTAQTAAVSARGRASTLPSIGVALGVSLLLEGSVQRAGERLRVTVRIVSVGNDSTVWVDRVEGSVDDAFAVQDAVSRAVVSALSTRLATADHRP